MAPYPVKFQAQVTVEVVKPMPLPLPNSEVEVLSRRLRVCLVDKAQKNPYVSNIHTLNAVWEADSPLVWKFPSQVQPVYLLLICSVVFFSSTTTKTALWSEQTLKVQE